LEDNVLAKTYCDSAKRIGAYSVESAVLNLEGSPMRPLTRLRKSVGLKLATAVTASLTVGVGAMMFVVTTRTQADAEQAALEAGRKAAESIRYEVSGRLNQAMDVTRTMHDAFKSLHVAGYQERSGYNAVLRGVLDSNPQILGAISSTRKALTLQVALFRTSTARALLSLLSHLPTTTSPVTETSTSLR
jgi:hypothetical protein